MLADFRFALRSLGRARGFTLVTIVTLALGIGSAAAIFSVTDWVLFRAGKFSPDLHLIGGQVGTDPFNPTRLEFMTRAYEQEKVAFTEFAKAAPSQGNVVIEGRPVATGWLGVTPNLLPMLGINPRLGRGFLPGEDREGSDQVVIVNHWFWKNHLGGREDALGRKIVVGEKVCTVIGVLPEQQSFPPYLYATVYRPLTYRVDPAMPWMPQFFLLGRIAPGVAREQAEAALRARKVDLPAQLAQYYANDRAVLSSLAELNNLSRPEIYWVMVGAVGFLYAIACLNASNLMLVRMLGQRRELSVRLALGAGRGRIIRLLVAESVTLAVLAGLAGLLVANWLFPLLLSATGSPGGGTRDWTTWTLGWRVVGVMGVLTVVTSLVIALIPAIRVLRTEINSGLKDGGAALGESPGLARLRGLLVVLQAAFAVILLAGAGLMIRTFANYQKIDLGFEPAGLAKVYIGFPPGYPGERDSEPRLVRLREISAELQHVSGVKAIGFGHDVLLPGYYFPSQTLAGPDGKPVKSSMMSFGLGFQDVAGIRLKRGRWLDQSKGNAILINETLARSLFPGEDPVGKFVRPQGANPAAGREWKGWEVAGVVGDIRSKLRDAPGNMIYSPESWSAQGFNVLVVRLGREFDVSFADSLRRRLYAFDSRLVVHAVMSVSEARDNQLWVERMANSVLKVLAGIALLLTVVGMFSVLAYTVDRRMGEFGVRMALGATKRDLAELVLRRGVRLTLVGVAFGLAGTLALSKFLRTLLFGTTPNDPWVLAAVGVILLFTSVVACVLPARRAARVDVARLLRSE
jgi:putative ABC transport system permease protein